MRERRETKFLGTIKKGRHKGGKKSIEKKYRSGNIQEYTETSRQTIKRKEEKEKPEIVKFTDVNPGRKQIKDKDKQRLFRETDRNCNKPTKTTRNNETAR